MTSMQTNNTCLNMASANMSLADKAPTSAKFFLKMLARLKHGNLHLVTPDNHVLHFGDTTQSQAIVLHIHDWRACGKIMRSGDIGFAEALEAGWLTTTDLTALLRLAIRNEAALDQAIFGGRIMSIWYKIKHLLRSNTKEGSRKNIHAHYDLGNSFYRLWLDPSWTYSSAIFYKDYQISLQEAQYRKYQRIIDVLGLKAGDKVLEIGCGWGGFAEHAGQQGIHVHGITISKAQLEIAQERIATQRLDANVQLELCDYRDLNTKYDAIVSIEMFEAVGEKFWPTYFATVERCLKPHGKALIQSITIDEKHFERYRSGSDFIQQYIFPGGMLPSPERFIAHAQKYNLETTNSFAFGLDYAETLRRWNKAFDQEIEAIAQQGFDTKFQRIWQMYFSYCEAGFEEKRTDVYQFLLQKKG